MSYSEENGQVTLTMSREDYQLMLIIFGAACGWMTLARAGNPGRVLELLNRLNEGNPNYTPYQVGDEKASL